MSKEVLVGTLGIIVNKEEQFLLVLRNNPEKPIVHEKWQLAGGKVEFGEQPEETLVREMKEELGVEINLLYPHPIAKANIWDVETYQRHVVLLGYICSIGSQPITLDHEGLEYQWFSEEEIASLDYLPNVDYFVSRANSLIKTHSLLDSL